MYLLFKNLFKNGTVIKKSSVWGLYGLNKGDIPNLSPPVSSLYFKSSHLHLPYKTWSCHLTLYRKLETILRNESISQNDELFFLKSFIWLHALKLPFNLPGCPSMSSRGSFLGWRSVTWPLTLWARTASATGTPWSSTARGGEAALPEAAGTIPVSPDCVVTGKIPSMHECTQWRS